MSGIFNNNNSKRSYALDALTRNTYLHVCIKIKTPLRPRASTEFHLGSIVLLQARTMMLPLREAWVPIQSVGVPRAVPACWWRVVLMQDRMSDHAVCQHLVLLRPGQALVIVGASNTLWIVSAQICRGLLCLRRGKCKVEESCVCPSNIWLETRSAVAVVWR